MMKRVGVLAVLVVFILLLLSSCANPKELELQGEKKLISLKYDEALSIFLKLTDIDPENPRGYTGAAEAYLKLGETEASRKAIETAYDHIEPDNPHLMTKDSFVCCQIARLCIENNDYIGARDVLRELLQRIPADQNGGELYGNVLGTLFVESLAESSYESDDYAEEILQRGGVITGLE